jgi:hypothetical protein
MFQALINFVTILVWPMHHGQKEHPWVLSQSAIRRYSETHGGYLLCIYTGDDNFHVSELSFSLKYVFILIEYDIYHLCYNPFDHRINCIKMFMMETLKFRVISGQMILRKYMSTE